MFNCTGVNHPASKIANRVTGFVVDHFVGVSNDILSRPNWDPANRCRRIDVGDLFHVVFKDSVLTVIIGIPIRFTDVVKICRDIVIGQHFAGGMIGIAIGNNATVTTGVTA